MVQFGSGWFSVGPVLVQSWLSVGSVGSVLVWVWFSLVQVGSMLDQVWFSLGAVLIQFGSVLAQFSFRFGHFGLCWLNVGSAFVFCRFNFGSVAVPVWFP